MARDLDSGGASGFDSRRTDISVSRVALQTASSNLGALGGSRFDTLNTVLTNQAVGSAWYPRDISEDQKGKLVSAVISALMEFKPTDAIEGMMAVQAVGLHTAMMECLRRAMIPEQPGDACNLLRKQAANLSRAFVEVVEALDRRRGKGRKQVVRVERVVVQDGGQAIVGDVNPGPAVAQEGGGP